MSNLTLMNEFFECNVLQHICSDSTSDVVGATFITNTTSYFGICISSVGCCSIIRGVLTGGNLTVLESLVLVVKFKCQGLVDEIRNRIACCLINQQLQTVAFAHACGDISFCSLDKLTAKVNSVVDLKQILIEDADVFTVAVRIREDYLSMPNALTWYETKDKKPILICANKGGDIYLIDVTLRRVCASFVAPQTPDCLDVIYDDITLTRYLLVSGFAGGQWLVPLEFKDTGLRETLLDLVSEDLKELKPFAVSSNCTTSSVRVSAHHGVHHSSPTPPRASVTSVNGKSCLSILDTENGVFQVFEDISMSKSLIRLSLPPAFVHRLHYSPRFCLIESIDGKMCIFINGAIVEKFSIDLRFDLQFPRDAPCLTRGIITAQTVSCVNENWGNMNSDSWLIVTNGQLVVCKIDRDALESKFATLVKNGKDFMIHFCTCFGLDYQVLCATVAPYPLTTGHPQDALDLYRYANTPLKTILAEFIRHGFVTFILPHVHTWLLSRNFIETTTTTASGSVSVIDCEKQNLSINLFELFLDLIVSPNTAHQTLVSISPIFHDFLLHNIWYRPIDCLKSLLANHLFSCSLIVVKTHNLNEVLLVQLLPIISNTAFTMNAAKLMFLPENLPLLLSDYSLANSFVDALERVDLTTILTTAPESQRIDNCFILTQFFQMFQPNSSVISDTIKRIRASVLIEGESDRCVALLCSYYLEVLVTNCDNETLNDFMRLKHQKLNKKSEIMAKPIACGSMHTAMVADNGLFCWGKSANSRLGRHMDVPTFSTPISVDFTHRIVQVACGSEHTICLTSDLTLISWGANTFGQLGQGTNVPEISSPHSLATWQQTNGIRLKDITCGKYHSLALDCNSDVYSFGWGAHGQLGHGSVEDFSLPTKVVLRDGRHQQKPFYSSGFSAGHAHSIFLATDGSIWGCGNNTYGQLGLGDNRKRKHLTRLCSGVRDEFSFVCAGSFHCFALNKRHNNLWTWGKAPHALKIKALLAKRRKATFDEKSKNSPNIDQEPLPPLDGGSQQSRINMAEGMTILDGVHLKPLQIDLTSLAGEKVVQIESGLQHSAILTKSGKVFVWGKSMEFQLGMSDKKERISPVLLTSLSGRKVVYISCGNDQTLAVDHSGLLWGWGKNDLCQLGFESVDPTSKHRFSGKSITIQKPGGKGGQRVISLPQDSRLFVQKPTRLVGYLAIVDLLSESEPSGSNLESSMARNLMEYKILQALIEFAGFYDAKAAELLCRENDLELLSIFVVLLDGKVAESVSSVLDRIDVMPGPKKQEKLLFLLNLLRTLIQCWTDNSKNTKSATIRDIFQIQNEILLHLIRFVEKNYTKSPELLSIVNEFLTGNWSSWLPVLVDMMKRCASVFDLFGNRFKLQIVRSSRLGTFHDNDGVGGVRNGDQKPIRIERSAFIEVTERSHESQKLLVFPCGHLVSADSNRNDILTEFVSNSCDDSNPGYSSDLLQLSEAFRLDQNDLCIKCALLKLECVL